MKHTQVLVSLMNKSKSQDVATHWSSAGQSALHQDCRQFTIDSMKQGYAPTWIFLHDQSALNGHSLPHCKDVRVHDNLMVTFPGMKPQYEKYECRQGKV